MARLSSFYLDSSVWHPPYFLDQAEAHHLVHVLRIQSNQQVRVFDGCGREGLFIVKKATKRQVELECLKERFVEREKRQCYLAIAWPKALRRSWLLEKCVELGVAGIYFWQACHSQGKCPLSPGEQWLPQLIAAGKQCETLWLPKLAVCPGGLSDLLEQTGHIDRKFLLWEKADQTTFVPANFSRSNSLFIFGPEGGLTEQEVDFLVDSGIQPYSLGKNILRWETAALLVAGLHSCLGQEHCRKKYERDFTDRNFRK